MPYQHVVGTHWQVPLTNGRTAEVVVEGPSQDTLELMYVKLNQGQGVSDLNDIFQYVPL